MSGKTSGLGDNFYIAGYDLSGDVASLDQINGGPKLLDFTPINVDAMVRGGGQRDGGMQFTSFMNNDAGQEHVALSTLPRTDVIASYLRGTTLGNAAACCIGKQVNYDPTRDNAGNLTLKVQVQANGYGLEWGIQGTPGLRTDTSATDGSSLDNGASSSHGLQAYLQVTAFTGTDVTVSVEHSADNSTFSSLVAFTAVTAAPASERKAVTGSVDEYLRVSTSTSGGFTSVTFAVVLVRNDTAVSF